MSLSRAIGLLITAYLGLIVATALAALSWRPLPDVPFLVALYAGLHSRPFASSGDGSSALLSLRNARPESMAGFGAVLGYLADVVEGRVEGRLVVRKTLGQPLTFLQHGGLAQVAQGLQDVADAPTRLEVVAEFDK